MCDGIGMNVFWGLERMRVYLLSSPIIRAFKELMLGSMCVLCRDLSVFTAELLARKKLSKNQSLPVYLRIRLIVISFHKMWLQLVF